MKLLKPADHVLIRCGAQESDAGGSVGPLDGFSVTHFAGIALGPWGIASSNSLVRSAPQLPLFDLVDASGEWLAIATGRGTEGPEYLVFSDAFAYAPVFFGLVPGVGLVLSESFQGAVAGARAAGADCQLDVAHYVATAAIDHQNMFSDATMTEDIQILPLGKCLRVTATRVEVLPRAVLRGAESYTDYEVVLAKGIERIGKVMESFASMPDVPKVLTLSGGVDSRLALAMLKSAGVAHLFQTRTVDPRTWAAPRSLAGIQRDMAIADKLRRDHGMALETKVSRDVHYLTFEETLGYHQSYRSNYYYAYEPRRYQTTSDTPLLVIRGGGGEILRATNGGILQSSKFAQRTDLKQSEADWLASRQLALNPAVTQSLKPLIHDVLMAAFSQAEGSSFEERLNHDYLRTRNRSHFGHIRQGSVGSEVSLHLVSDPYFLQASRLIPFEEKAVGGLVRELFRLAPELLRYPFENDEWNRRLGVQPQFEVDFEGEPWAQDIDANQASAGGCSVAAGREAGVAGSLRDFSPERSALSYIKFGFAEIIERVSPEMREDIQDQHDGLLALAVKSAPIRGRILTKVASALDVFHPPTLEGASMTLDTARTKSSLPRSTINIVSSSNARGFPVPEQAPELRMDSAGFTVDARPSPLGMEHQLEFAFYLFKDGVRVESRWYEEKYTMRFSQPVVPGQYSATSFMRKRGAEGLIWVDRTDYVLVGSHPVRREGLALGSVGSTFAAVRGLTSVKQFCRVPRGVRRRFARMISRLKFLRGRRLDNSLSN